MVEENLSSVQVISLDNAGELAKVISNKTSQAIIEFVRSNKGATASQIAKALSLPASTVHYNMSALVKAKIISNESFHYSSKGKEVINYEVSDQVIVIVPSESSSSSLSSQLKNILPGILGGVGLVCVWFGVSFFRMFSSSRSVASSVDLMSMPVAESTNDVGVVASKMAADVPMAVARSAPMSSEPNSAFLIFLGVGIGFLLVVLGMIVRSYILKKRRSKNSSVAHKHQVKRKKK